jgi:[heparan sulfate]-glucosamine 3-sulfotransferase 3
MPLSSQHQMTIEKTPKYLVDKRVPRRVFRMNPNIKLIVVVRNPVERAISEYVQSKENRVRKRRLVHRRQAYATTLNDSTTVRRMIYDSDGRIRLDKPMVRNGLYVEHLKNWLNFFPLEQFLFVNGESLVRTPSVEMKRMEAFLGLKHVIKKEHFVFNQRKGFPCIYKPLDSQQVRCLNEQKGRKHPVIEQEILDDLNEVFRPYNKEFFETIKQDAWWP